MAVVVVDVVDVVDVSKPLRKLSVVEDGESVSPVEGLSVGVSRRSVVGFGVPIGALVVPAVGCTRVVNELELSFAHVLLLVQTYPF